MKKHIFTGIVIVSLCILVGVRVVQQRQLVHQSSSATSLRVVASFYPLAEFAKHVGGNLVSVTNLTPAGSEPHDFDPSPRDIATLQNANVFIYNGVGLEPWVNRVLSDLRNNGSIVVNVTDGLPLIAHDPHVWMDPLAVIIEVQKIAGAFSASDPVHEQQYADNAQQYISELQQLNTAFEQGLSACTLHEVVTSHAALAYLGRQYSFTAIPIAGISPDAEPSPARLVEISKLVRSHGIRHILFETLVSPALSQTIATETGATTVSFNPLEGLTKQEIMDGKNYISVQRDNLAVLRTALNCL